MTGREREGIFTFAGEVLRGTPITSIYSFQGCACMPAFYNRMKESMRPTQRWMCSIHSLTWTAVLIFEHICAHKSAIFLFVLGEGGRLSPPSKVDFLCDVGDDSFVRIPLDGLLAVGTPLPPAPLPFGALP